MKLSRKLQYIPLSLLDLTREIQSEPLKKQSDEKIEEIQNNIRIHEGRNKKLKSEIAKAKRILNSKKSTLFQKLEASYNIEITSKNITDISSMKNDLNKAQGKDYYFTVNDNFNPIYKVKRSSVIKMKDNSFFIKKYKNAVLKEIENLEKKGNNDSSDLNKINVLRNKLLKVIEFNENIDKYGNVEVSKIPKRIKKQIDLAIDQEIEKSEKDGKYPINVELFGTSIEF
jgi:hypothetical protein